MKGASTIMIRKCTWLSLSPTILINTEIRKKNVLEYLIWSLVLICWGPHLFTRFHLWNGRETLFLQ